MSKRLKKLGFMVRAQVAPGRPYQEHAAFMRRWDDYLVEHDLMSVGAPGAATIWADHRDVEPADQVDMMLWLLDQPLVRSVSLSPLDASIDDPEVMRALPVVHARFGDLSVIPLKWLYRARRIDARQFIDILGGHTCAAQLH